jgi:acyl transferase domain-containing protein/NADPH:quinone reductase-like Zn-dependent oxidoreductase/acyl carrier protein/NADP-dependent 3-hydroxy acid dehydrogenase YdfG
MLLRCDSVHGLLFNNCSQTTIGPVTVAHNTNPIAIVGIANRLPGPGGDALTTSRSLWQALLQGKSLISSVEQSRWGQDALLHPRRAEPGSAYTFAAGSIGDVAGFDAAFFGISPREAGQMDPQQRLLLELTWEALENAGIPPSSIRGRRWSVYLGLSTLDYAYRRAEDLAAIDATTMTGNTASVAANRISYVFDLRGPSMAVDTACSSALVAFHQACLSIRCGESAGAVVGGVSLHLHPYPFIGFSKASMLSRSGRCSVFDAAADGYVRAEGGAVVILKPLEQALADGNRILALVAGSGVNTDGHKQGLSVPSHVVQADLLREVYAQAGIAPGEIDYLEAHGTGTPVGDPIETHALGEAIGQARAAGKPLPIGSIKSNLGHLEAASGMAGLAKALLVIEHRCVPPTINLTEPNPNIRFDEWNLAPVTEPLPLAPDRRVVVGINSFGFGGANAHVVLTSYENGAGPNAGSTAALPTVSSAANAPIVLSARSPQALRESAGRMAQHLLDRPDDSVYDIAYSAFFNRDAHSLRLLTTGPDRAALAERLQRFAAGGNAEGVVTGSHLPNATAPAFVYSGNGSQWAGMGQRLLETDETFRRAVEEVDALLVAEGGSSVLDELTKPIKQSGMALTEVAQPALFAVQVGLTRMLQQRGVSPGATCGHSVGEVAAAWASGALSLDQAVLVIHRRSMLQATTKGAGQMTAVALGEAEVGAILGSLGLAGRLTLAGLNSPHGVTVAGDAEALTRLEAELVRGKARFKRLHLDYAFHAPAMDPIRERLRQSLAGLQPHSSRIAFYSTVSGGLLAGERLDADYWWHNVRDPVRFQDAIQAMLLSGINSFVEVGPDALLRTYLNECVRDPKLKARGAVPEARVLHTMKRNEARSDPVGRVFEELLLAGAPVDTATIFPVAGRPVDLPSYPWQRERHWLPTTPESMAVLDRRVVHPLLGYPVASIDLTWENHLDTARLPTYADHAVGGAVVFPGSGFVELALAASAQWKPSETTAIEDLEIKAPLLLSAERSRTVRVQIDATDGRFTIKARDRLSTDPWVAHATGRIIEAPVPLQAPSLSLPVVPCNAEADEHYRLAEALGLQYGPAFRAVSSVWLEPDALVAALHTPATIEPEIGQTLLHPSFLDGAFQSLADLVAHQAIRPLDGTAHEPPAASIAYLPVRIERLQVLVPKSRVRSARVALVRRTARSLVADFTLHDETGQAVSVVLKARFRAAHLARSAQERMRLVGVRAVPMPRRDTAHRPDLQSPRDFAARCARRLHQPQRVAARRRFSDEVDPLLDVLCTAFAEHALRQAGACEPSLDPTRLIAMGVVAPSAESLLLRLLQMVAEHDLVEPAGERWLWRSAGRLPPPHDILTSLVADYPEYASLAGRVGSSGLRLAARLHAGSLSEPVGLHTAERAGAWRQCCTQAQAHDVLAALGDVVHQACALQPVGGRLRVLYAVSDAELMDIGWIRDLDHDRCELVIGTGCADLIDMLKTRLEGDCVPAVRAIDLDSADLVETQPASGFDLVVIADGVALAPDPMARVNRARHLLADHGLLVLLEQHPSSEADFIFGTDPRWWQASDPGQPVCSRLRSPGAWREVLARCGFFDTEVVTDLPAGDGALPPAAASGPYLVLARAGATEHPTQPPTPTTIRTWVVLQDETGYAAELGDEIENELSTRGHRVITVVAAPAFKGKSDMQFGLNPASEAGWARLIETLRLAGHSPEGWVHLHGLTPGRVTASATARLSAQWERACALTAWLKACAGAGISPDTWVVGSQAGLALMPLGAAGAAAADADRMRDAALWGVARVAMHECAPMRVRWVDLIEPQPCVLNAAKLVREMLDPDGEDEILLTLNARYVPRMSVLPALAPPQRRARPAPAVRLEISNPGSLNNLVWRRHEFVAPAPGEVEIQVHAAGLNFRDVMYAIGLLPDEALENGFSGPTLGMELSGVVTRVGAGVTELVPGQEVLAFAPAAFGNRVLTQAAAVVPKPAGWTFAAAATVPTAFFTAYYALGELARLREGERILIHGAAGGVGLAAIQLAKHLGAEVFATAGTPEKRDFVRLMGAHHVFDSRSLAFADQVMAATGGAGVDVILNSLAGEAVTRNLHILRPFGRLLELGKRDFYENTHIGLRPFRNNIAYFGIDADQLMAHRPDLTRRLWLELMALFASGTLHPLPHRSFSAIDVADAFRYMRDSRQTGKIVVEFPADFDPPETEAQAPQPAFRLRTDATYLVAGGLTGFGLRTAQWLVERGASHLALLGRRGPDTPEAGPLLQSWRSAGVAVHAIACDVADSDALGAALAGLRGSAPPLRGVIHAAMVMDDALIRNLDASRLGAVLAPKIAGALNLHRVTLNAPLDFFVLYSSATTLFGNPGQAAYVAANMALESLGAERRALGLPATCIQWGPIGDAGYLARNSGVRDALAARLGGQPLSADRALKLLEDVLASGTAQVAAFEFNWSTLARHLPGAASPKFSELARLAEREGSGPQPTEDLRRWLAELADEELAPALTEILKREIGVILRVAPERIDPAVSLYEVGMDSLMAVELTMALESRLAIKVPMMAFSEGPTIERLVQRLLNDLRPGSTGEPAAAPSEAMVADTQAVAAQHAHDLDAETVARIARELAGDAARDSAHSMSQPALPTRNQPS